MSDQPRPLPERPSLRYLKLAAKRRLAAGEFPTLHDAQLAIAREHGMSSWTALKQFVEQPTGPALTQLRWVLSRYSDAASPTWVAPGADELRDHFDDSFLHAVPPEKLRTALTPLASHQLVVTENTPTRVLARIAGRHVQAVVEADTPNRLLGLLMFRPGTVTDPRVANPATHTSGNVPEPVVAIAESEFTELRLPGLVLAAGEPAGGTWSLARGWADLERDEPLRPDHRFPAHTITRLVTAMAVLRLVADGRVALDDRLADLLGGTDPALDQLITDVTGLPSADAVTALVLEPLGMHGSTFGTRPETALTGYTLTPEGVFEPVVPTEGGLWTTVADLVRFGLTWSTLLPDDLAHQAITPRAERAGSHVGLGWLVDRPGELIGYPDIGVGGSVSLVVRLRDGRVHVAATNRRIPIEPTNGRVLRATTP